MSRPCWAQAHIERLSNGEHAVFRPLGHSMMPLIRTGQLCKVAPVNGDDLAVGDIVLCRVGRTAYLHLIKAIDGARFQIGNNRGRINGWVGRENIFGRLVSIGDND